MLTVSVIIPTYNRLDDLTVCMQSLLKQTLLPQEILIIDDGALPFVPLQKECEQQGIRVIYFKKDKPGLTASRNVGIRLATGDLIYFLDDDVELFPDYIAQIYQVFAQDTQQQIAGVGGMIANEKPLSLSHQLRRLLDCLFLVTGNTEGRVLPSGFCVNFGATGKPFTQVTNVDFLAGGVSAYRQQVFATHLFSEAYKGYGLGEDKDFSYRLSRQARLVVTPDAKLNHYESPQMRFDHQERGKAFILARYQFFIEHVKQHRWQWLLFGYAVFGYTLGRCIILLISMKRTEWQRIKGIFSAIKWMLTKGLKDK